MAEGRSRTCVPAAPIARVVQAWVIKETQAFGFPPLRRLAQDTGIPYETLRKLHREEWVEFWRADRIITTINPWLWRVDDELKAIYQGFDFSWLDRTKPLAAA